MKAILLIDFINEIVHLDGKLSKRGYPEFIKNHDTFSNLKKLTEKARAKNMPIIHVKIGFSTDHKEAPVNSPLFGLVKKFDALKLNTWATEFHEDMDVQEGDSIIALILPRPIPIPSS